MDALSTDDIDFAWDHFLNSLNSALDHVAPYRTVSARNSVSTSKTRTALRYKRRCYRDLILRPSFDNLISYMRSKLIARRVLDENIAVREERIINAKNSKIFWSYVNRRLGSDSRIEFVVHEGVNIHDSQKMADLFNDYFVSTFTTASSNLATPCTPSSTVVKPSLPSLLTHIDLSLEDVSVTLNKLPPKTSVDADNVSYMILKNGGLSVALRLFQLYSLSLRVSRIPSSWKSAMVSPIFKKGSKSDVHNYRPISVTSCCSRILERIINKKISSFLTKNSVIKCSQHGFTHGKSTDTLLISFYDYVTDCLDRNLAVDSVFFDFQKAFDSVPHHKLILRLFSVGIRGNLLDWLKDFLSNRTQAVSIDRSRSNSLPVNSGVIQGTVLGPTLFNIFVNDIDESLKYCNIFKYADDIRIFRSSARNYRDLSDLHHKIQQDIDSIVAWSLASGLKLNADKCFSVSFGNRDSVEFYTLNGVSIPKNDTFSDLGITVLSPFSFKSHVDKIVSKAFRKLGLINRIFMNKTKRSVTNLYKAYVRSSLEYSSVVWSPHTISSIDSIERVQRRMCRLIPAIRHLPYRLQLKSLGLLSLRARRLRFQLITLFKIQKGLLNINFDDFFLLHGLRGTRGHNLRIIPKFSHYNYRLHFFTVSVISFWNQLSKEDVDVSSVASFKIRLHSFFIRHDIW
ncbi:MAG: reverse transcriptase family protein [Pseudomonadota bacterium]